MCAHRQGAQHLGPIVERNTLANLPSKLASDAPPDGLQWGDGEPGSARRRSSSPDVKGVFGEGASVVAMTPPPPPPAAGPAGLRTLAKLFLSEPPKRSGRPENDNQPAPAAAQSTHANNIGVWSDAKPETATVKRGITWQGVGSLPRAVIGHVAASLLPRPVAPPPASIATAPAASLLPQASTAVLAAASSETPISDADSLELERTPTGNELDARASDGDSGEPAEISISAPPPSPRPAKLRSAPAPVAAVINKTPSYAAPQLTLQTPLAELRANEPRKSARRMAAPDFLLGGGAIVLTLIALYLGGAYAKLWSLSPSLAALLNLESGARPSPNPSKLALPSQPSAAEQALAKLPVLAPQPAALPPTAADAPTLAQPSAAAPETTDKEPANAAPLPSAADAPEQAAPQPPEEAPQQGTTKSPSGPTSEGATNETTQVLSDERLLLAVHHKLAADDLAGAEALARRAIANNADDHHAMEALVEVLIEETRGAEAVKYAVQIVRKRPKRVAYRMLEGDARLLANDKVGAQRAWREALALEPGNRDAKRRLGLAP